MKKKFSLSSTKHKPERQVELIKSDINKYIARERRKELPAKVDFWNFDCKCGPDEKSAVTVHVSTIGKEVDKIFQSKAESVYVEILAKPGIRTKKEVVRQKDDDTDEFDFED